MRKAASEIVTVFETSRLSVRRLVVDDAEFMLRLMNDPSWIRFIGDRGIATVDDAKANLLKGPIAMYERNGFGLYLVTLLGQETPIGICGPIKRDTLTDIDLGFAYLPEYLGKGYALEAAQATLDYVKLKLAVSRIVAITMAENVRSIRLLKKLGFRYEKDARLSATSHPVQVYGLEL